MKRWIASLLISLIVTLPIQAAEICRIWPDGQADGLPDMVVTRSTGATGVDAYGQIRTHGTPVVLQGSYIAGAMKADLTSTNAFAEFGVNLSAYQDGNYYIELSDGTYTAGGYIKDGAPGGLTVSATDLLSGWNLTSGWSKKTETTIDDLNTFTITSTTNGWIANSSLLTAKKCYYGTLNYTATSGTDVTVKNGSISITYFVGDSTGYFSALDTYWVIRYGAAAGNSVDIDQQTVKQVTDIAATGAHIVSTKLGSTRAWASAHESFNPNAAGTYKIYYLGGASLVASNTYAAGAMKADLTATNAFAEFGVDLSAYQTGTYYLQLSDGTYTAGGYINTDVPGGLTLSGTELITNGDGESLTGWTQTPSGIGAVVAGGQAGNCFQITENGTAYPYLSRALTTSTNGWQYSFSYYVKQGTISTYRGYITGSSVIATVPNVVDRTSTNSWVLQGPFYTIQYAAGGVTAALMSRATAGSGLTHLFDTISAQRVTDIATTGAHIVSTKGGATRAWASQHASFNPNLAGTYKIYSVSEYDSLSGPGSINNFKLQSLPVSGYTNLHPYSYAVGSWTTKANLNTTSPVLVVDPAAGTLGFPFIPTDGGTEHAGKQNLGGLTDSTVYCGSEFVKAGTPIGVQTKVWVNLRLVLKDNTDPGCFFNITDGTVGGSSTTYSGIDSKIYYDSNGGQWRRIWIAHSVLTGGTTPQLVTRIAEQNNDASFTGDNTTPSFYAYGAQVTEGAYPLPLAVTNGSTVSVGGETKTIDISAATGATYPQILKLRDSLINTGTGDTDSISKGTMLVRIVPRFGFSLPTSDAQFISTIITNNSLLYMSSSQDDFRSTDLTNYPSSNSTDADPLGDGTEFFVKVIWDSTVVAPTTGKLQVSDSRNGGVSWLDGTATNFVGSFSLTDTFRLGYINAYPFDIGPIIFYDTVLTNDEATVELLKNGYSAGLLGP